MAKNGNLASVDLSIIAAFCRHFSSLLFTSILSLDEVSELIKNARFHLETGHF